MSRSFKFKDIVFSVGDEIAISYKIFENNKEKKQKYKGILISIKGNPFSNKMITIRKVSKSGVGIEKIIPINSPNIIEIIKTKITSNKKSNISYIRMLSQQEIKTKIYKK